MQRPWTEQELAEKISRQNGLKLKYSGMQRERVQKALAEARSHGDEARAARLQEELDGMEATPRLAFRTSLTPADGSANNSPGGTPNGKSGGRAATQQERLALLNLENRRKNAESVRQAQIKERAKAREAEARRVKEQQARRQQQQQQEAEDEDSATRARVVVLNNGTPSVGGDEELEKLKRLQREKETTTRGIPTIHKPLMDDDIIGALDLGIDVDIEV